MNRFWKLVTRPVLEMVDAKAVVEIGAALGQHTRLVAPWCVSHGATFHIIDPVPGFKPERFHEPERGVRVDQRLSIEALTGAEPVDVALVDGDHNYYTVRRELEILLENARAAGRPAPVFLCHDVGWPYGRRDLYYDPSNVPAEHRQPNRKAGMAFGKSELVDGGGLSPHVHNAEHEGGPRNGVLTAIEDVIAEQTDAGLRLTVLPVLYGLGIVVPAARLERHPELATWLGRWETAEGWRELAELAEVERRVGDERLQRTVFALRDEKARNAAAPAAAPAPAPDTRVAEVRGRSFRTALPPDVLTGIQRGTINTGYKGRKFWKNPFDVVNYIQLLGWLRPRTILELGTKDGGSALWFADQQAARGIEPRVVTVDIKAPKPLDDDRITFLQGDALALGDVLADELLAALPRPWLVIEDTAHRYETTLAALEFFDAWLRPGDYIVVEDGNLADFAEPQYRDYEDGPNRAVKQFLEARGDAYEIDERLCDRYGHNVTWSPNGWLRRSDAAQAERRQ